ncbi:hypothetical protein ACVW04_007982 [Bradyrhizobium sp. LM2.3]
MKELCTRYLADLQAGLILGKGGRTKKASTIVTDTGRIERHIIPLIGTRRVKDLTKTDINKVLKDIMAGKTRVSVKTKKLLKRSRHRLPSSIPSQYLLGAHRRSGGTPDACARGQQNPLPPPRH